MHKSRTILLVNDAVRAIRAIYDFEPKDRPGSVKRTLFKTFDPTIAVDDLIIVPSSTRHNFTVVKVVEIDVDTDDELTGAQNETAVEWIVGKVDLQGHQRTLSQEGEFLATVAKAKRAKERADLEKTVFGDVDVAKLKALPIAQRAEDGAPAAIKPPAE